MRQVLLFQDEESGWVAGCPSLPGCVSQGDTREEAIENIKEAIAAYIEALELEGLAVPKERYTALPIAV